MLDDRPPAADAGVTDATSLRTLLRATVHNADGQPLGRIEDAAIDAEAGALVYALLAFDDFTGVTKRFVIPWSALRIDPSDGSLVLNLDPEVLERSPGFAAVELAESVGGEPQAAAALAGVGPTEEPAWRPRWPRRFGH